MKTLIALTFAWFGLNASAAPLPVSITWGQQMVMAPTVWSQGVTGKGVLVAVIDSGLDIQHVQFQGRVYTNPNEILNGIDDDNNGYIDDIHGWNYIAKSGNIFDDAGHGTWLSGIIAADPKAGTVHGMAPDATILPLKFLDNTGSGSITNGIAAMQYAAWAGAKIIIATWATPNPSDALKAEINLLATQGILVVTGAGNDALDLRATPSYPAAWTLPNLIKVAATTNNDELAGFSNYGTLVDLGAPGTNIFTTVPNSPRGQWFNSSTLSAAFVAGAAALIWSQDPKLTYQEVSARLLGGVAYTALPVRSAGRLNVANSLK